MRFLDSYVPYWHETRGAGFGVELIDAPAFRTGWPNLLTTGAYSLRYAAELGYTQLILLGIDLDYQPLPEAAEADGLRLVMTETPKENPNYFFDDYQQAGDEFHVPNPESHDQELHVAAFAAVRDDFENEGLDIELINTNPASRLNLEGILPYSDIRKVLGEPALGAVVVPLTPGEHEQLMDNLWLWSLPGFAPFLGKKPRQVPDLIFVCNNARAAAIEPTVLEAMNSAPHLRACFNDIRFIDLNLSGDRDLYLRDNVGPASEFGWRAGPNHLFFGALEALKQHWGHALFMETDCVPIHAGWLGKFNNLLASDELPWVIGSIYRGSDPLGSREKRHINGNAIYATGDPAFHDFVETIWRPKLDQMVKERPELAFDCVLEALYEQANALAGDDDELWKALRSASHKFRYTEAIVNLTSARRGPYKLVKQITDAMSTSPNACLVHSRMLATYVTVLRRSETPRNLKAMLDLMRAEAPDALLPTLPEAPPTSMGTVSPRPPWTVKRIVSGVARRALNWAGG
ncbi:MAG: hypothetical protein CVT79_10485 [Alphaproteobacteria bacterium HGW-Alphaproteobacteria-18]|nr:MAG: hypothetical protein CVT79_10485 [Alphaproteobacteria bacterium HGW-Alphaproteobacteria-18]